MADSTLPLSRLRARLAAPRGTRKIDALLGADDPSEAVAALPPIEVHELVHEVGFADALELIALATPAQLRGCMDIDAWNRDSMELGGVLPWLGALVEAGYERLGQVWAELDAELAALILARTTHIYDLSLDDEPDDSDGQPMVTTPDTFFAIKLTADDDDTVRLIHRIIDDLYRADPSGALARHTIMAARSEPMAELEETSYRWRTGRMADLGYVEFYEALEVFRPLEPGAVRIEEGSEDRFGDMVEASTPLPVPIAERVVGRSFLARALDRIEDAREIERLELALVVLVNKVLSAARVSPGDQEAIAIAADHATATLALGLEAVSQGDVARAARALETVSLTRLHRVGTTIPLRLAHMARALTPRAITAGGSTDALLEALCRRRPFFPRELDQPPGSGVRPFESTDDVRVVAEALTKLALRVAIADGLGVDVLAMAQRPEPRPALDDHVRTALVRAMLGEPLAPVALGAGDIARFVRTAMAKGSIVPQARDAARRALEARLDTAEITAARQYLPELLHAWLADLEDALGHLPPDPDPRFIDRVLVAARRE